MISQGLFSWLLKAAIIFTGLYLFIIGAIAPDKIATLVAPVGFVSGAILIIFGYLDRTIWRWPWIHGWLKAAPISEGTWKGEFQSSYIDPVTKEVIPPREIYAVVRQTLSAVSVKMFTDRMASDTLVATFIREKDTCQIAATYESIPKLQFRDDSPIHRGGFLITVTGTPTNQMEGHYWTDNKTRGTIIFTQRHSQLTDTFESARSLFSPATN